MKLTFNHRDLQNLFSNLTNISNYHTLEFVGCGDEASSGIQHAK